MTEKYACTQLIQNTCVAWQKINNNSLGVDITTEQAKQTFVAIATMFAVAWCYKQLARFLQQR